MNTEQTTNIIKYLLGNLADDERSKIEDRLFTDTEFADLADETENDLIDEYVRGELETTQKNRFEQFFLISERRREKVKLARILNDKIFNTKSFVFSAKPEGISFWKSLGVFFRFPVLRIATVVITLLAILTGGFWLLRPSQKDQISRTNPNTETYQMPSPEIDNSNSENINSPQNISIPDTNKTNVNENRVPKTTLKTGNSSSSPNPAPPVKNENTSVTAQQLNFASILLLPISRSSESPTLKISNPVKSAHLQLVNNENEQYEIFRIDVVDSNGGLIFRREFDGKRKTKTFSLNIPTEKLSDQNYEITLSGANIDRNFKNLNYYHFSVQKK